jgi:hypothetical protein
LRGQSRHVVLGIKSRPIDCERLQQRFVRIAIRDHGEFHLDIANAVSHVEIDVPFEVIYLVSQIGKLMLKGNPRQARNRALVTRSGGAHRTLPAQAIRKQADRERVGVRIIVLLDDGIIIRSDERGSG